jgi:predicted outer membrane repeat protein
MRAVSTIRSVISVTVLTVGLAAVPSSAHADTTVPCSEIALVDAVQAVNSAGGGRLALAPSCTYVLTEAHGAGAGPSGLPVITTPITLTGTGTIITRAPTASAFRILEVDGPAQRPGTNGQLTLTSVTLRGGDAGFGVGGGLANFGGMVTLFASIVSGSTASYGGGIYSNGTLTLTAGMVTGNTATVAGGGIYNDSGVVARRGTAIGGNTPDNCAPPGSVSGGCPS